MDKEPIAHPMVHVAWLGSNAITWWTEAEFVMGHEPAPCLSVGYLVRDEPEFIVIVQSSAHTPGHNVVCTGPDQYDAAIAIPKSCILSQVELIIDN